MFSELRVAREALSADWIATEYNNQIDPGAFISVGTPQSTGGATNIGPAGTAHSHGAADAGLSQVHGLTLDGATHGHGGANGVLGQVHNLSGHSAAKGHVAERISLVQRHVVGIGPGVHLHSTDSVPVSTADALGIDAAVLGHAGGATALIQSHILATANASHRQAVQAASLVPPSAGVPAERTINPRSGRPRLFPRHDERTSPVRAHRRFSVTTNR